MKNLLKVVFVIAFAMLANSTFAQQKFAHINRTELIQSMPDFKTAQEKLEAYYKEISAQLEEGQVEINKKLVAYQNLPTTSTEEEKEAKMKQIQDMSRRLEEQKQTAQEDLQKKEQDLFAPVLKKAGDAINKVAASGGYVYVFESTAVHYVDETLSTNILSAVKKELGIN
ncbi:MAG: OmpH family outer membrane protein [Prevotellaceae bacterium]|jgi:outer membrane protein|nr:OmpH family outer membrane protein [Prevotellaceae bacterium]